MTNIREFEIAEQFLNHGDENSYNELFRLISPQLVAFFRRQGHEESLPKIWHRR